ncbi:hypothetical protein QF20_004406 [Salmonella enterica subsp. enterica]|uniref:Uncharacterized protein n=2 Tax=Salmonella enterica TaxID=28901 RepID=A0A744EQL6_SALER|nr:hypothetical protein [Salmonella enterica]EAA4188419.1 hypothetical protein [Salmonella enterica subsp. enterica serovar Mikawasima]EAC0381153.1 hypothetical protein [Salmonella enterica subsp. enterica serovar Potsdam]EBR8657983.1 hypothetical protein [Salmonella enterica subsp. enterica serovar Kottbus]EBS1713166.1 hypothetical protein [Salmonella enterica subsp. enterica serovar Vitkin]EBS5860729.1 hypothetical protein [Salmonella enterica subsp. enterica serovar Richmond]EBW5295218.1 h
MAKLETSAEYTPPRRWDSPQLKQDINGTTLKLTECGKQRIWYQIVSSEKQQNPLTQKAFLYAFSSAVTPLARVMIVIGRVQESIVQPHKITQMGFYR